jgi:hypothetical protein
MCEYVAAMSVETSTTVDNGTGPAGRALELSIVFVGFAVATIVMTLPVWQHPTRRLPSDLVDTLLSTWIIGWDADRLRHGLSGLWDAPIFYPYRNTLAFSENLLGVAVFVAPVYWVTGNPVLTYNVAFTLSFVVAGVGMYVLAAVLTHSRRCALIAATFYAFCPFRFIQLSHIQLIATGWMPVALYGLHRYFATSRRPWLTVFVVAFLIQALSNSYVAYFMVLPVGVVVVEALWRERTGRVRRLVELVAAGLLIAVALIPVARKYYQVRSDYGHVRRLVEMNMGSADVRSYVIGNPSIGIWRWLRAAAKVEPERELFPGVAALALAVVGLSHLRRRDEITRWVAVYGLIAMVAIALSLGPQPRIWGRMLTAHGPYDWLLRIVPGMNGMRVPARFAIIFFLALAVLAACGASLIEARVPTPLRSPATALCILVILAESWMVPLPVYSHVARGRPTDRAVAEWLRDRPSGAVLHLPMTNANFRELSYQYGTLVHAHPIVNGMSGYDSPLQMLFRDNSSPLYDSDRPSDVIRMLRSLGVRYVVVHLEDYTMTQLANDQHRAALAMLRNSGQVVQERRFLEALAFELEPPIVPPPAEPAVRIDPRDTRLSVSGPQARLPYLLDRNPDTRWLDRQNGSSWIAVDFIRPCNVARVDLRLAARSIFDYPRELEIAATDDNGVTRTLYRATPYPEFISGFVGDPNYPRISIALPPNRATRLTIRETGTVVGRWWSVHELELWQPLSR